MSSEEASNSPGLKSIKEQKPGLYSWTRARDQFLSCSPSAGKTLLLCHVLVTKPAVNIYIYIFQIYIYIYIYIFCLETPMAGSIPTNW